MTMYLGISLIIVVAAVCIALLSRFIPENAYKAYEGYKKRSADRRWAAVAKVVADPKIQEMFTGIINIIKEDIEKEKKIREDIKKEIEELNVDSEKD